MNKSMKQILLCVETTKQANTDYQYIRETILHFYEENRKIVYRPVYLESKSRYNNPAVLKEIKTRQKAFPGKTHVIYFIDTDNWNVSPEDRQMHEQICTFCNNISYDLVFFCKDIEEVYCGSKIPATKKVRTVEQFKRSHLIETVNADHLQSDRYIPGTSNILNVLDKYWNRKP